MPTPEVWAAAKTNAGRLRSLAKNSKVYAEEDQQRSNPEPENRGTLQKLLLTLLSAYKVWLDYSAGMSMQQNKEQTSDIATMLSLPSTKRRRTEGPSDNRSVSASDNAFDPYTAATAERQSTKYPRDDNGVPTSEIISNPSTADARGRQVKRRQTELPTTRSGSSSLPATSSSAQTLQQNQRSGRDERIVWAQSSLTLRSRSFSQPLCQREDCSCYAQCSYSILSADISLQEISKKGL